MLCLTMPRYLPSRLLKGCSQAVLGTVSMFTFLTGQQLLAVFSLHLQATFYFCSFHDHIINNYKHKKKKDEQMSGQLSLELQVRN